MSDNGLTLKIHGATFKTDYRELVAGLVGGLAKTFVAIKTHGASLALGSNIVADFSGVIKAFKVQKTVEHQAWVLISGALLFAIQRTLIDVGLGKAPAAADLRKLANDIATRVETRTYTIEPNFFSAPNKLSLLQDVAHELAAWISQFGSNLTPQIAKAHLERHFPSGLHRVWVKNNSSFEGLRAFLNSPFESALTARQEGDAYLQFLEDDFEQAHLIGQDPDDPTAVRLAQVFIPLRAYFEEETTDRTPKHPKQRPPGLEEVEEPPTQRVVVNLFEELEDWIKGATHIDPLRIISGGPGIGKSSSMRAFAARTARDLNAFPILISLQKLSNSHLALRARIDDYLSASKTCALTKSPLDGAENGAIPETLLLIFDGLDELVRPGKDADEIAREFMFELHRLLESENNARKRLKLAPVLAIVSGRMASAGSAARTLKQTGRQVLHLLRFAEQKDEQKEYFDPKGLLKTDQRKVWWELWRRAAKHVPQKIPRSILADDLFDVTVEPLLLYFVAFVRPWETGEKGKELDRNWLYSKLLESFYSREFAKGDRNFATEFQDFAEYEMVLQAMALAAWYDGSTRTATIDAVLVLLSNWNNDLANSLLRVLGGNKPAISAALSFYMKPGESPNSFEFLHKTFAEYLVARRTVEAVNTINVDFENIQNQKGLIRKSFDDEEKLLEWLRLFGPRAIDSDVLRFLRDEFSRQHSHKADQIQKWRTVLSRCLTTALNFGMPAHKLFSLPEKAVFRRPQHFRDAIEQSRNSEEALLAALNATILPVVQEANYEMVNLDISEMGAWNNFIYRLQASADSQESIALQLLSGLNLSSWAFAGHDLSEIVAIRSDFSEGIYVFAQCFGGNFQSANFSKSDLSYARFFDTDFSDTLLAGASLTGTVFEDCFFIHANLEGAICSRAEFRSTDMNEANLGGAEFRNSKFASSNLAGANFVKSDLSYTTFSSTNLSRSDFSGSNLEGATFVDTTIEGAVFEGANLTGASFQTPESKGN